MIETIGNLPPGVTGIRATGHTRAADAEVIERLVDQAADEGRKLRLLCELGPELQAISPAAALQGARAALRHAEQLERCAIVTDSRVLGSVAEHTGKLMPFPVRVFDLAERGDALDWLGRPPRQRGASHRYLSDRCVMIVRIHGPLHAEDFEALAIAVDALVSSGAGLRGIVVRSRSTVPGWENLGSLLRHLRFIRNQSKHVPRVAFAISHPTTAAALASLLGRIVSPELRVFEYGQLDEAVQWAATGDADPQHDDARTVHAAVDAAQSPRRDADPVQRAGMASFPASDPPSFTPEREQPGS